LSDVHNVLFLCSGNSARSVMAEAILNREGAGKFQAFAASVDPQAELNPHAVTVLKNFGYDLSDLSVKPWSEFAQGPSNLHFVFTVCDVAAGEAPPEWPGQPITAHWGIPDPAKVAATEAEIAAAFDVAFGMLRRRVELLLALPVAKLDRMALASHLNEIGRSDGAPAPAP
jgi:arsenate reductase